MNVDDLLRQVKTLVLGEELNWFSFYHAFVAFLVVFLSMVILLAATNLTVGVRFTYINILKFIFNWGKERIERDTPTLFRQSSSSVHQLCEHDDMEQREPGTPEADDFHLSDPMSFARRGVISLIEDDVTKSFDAAELSSWNLLTRTNMNYQYVSFRLTVIFLLGCVLRYFILFPFRLILAFVAIGSMITGTFLVGLLPEGKVKKLVHKRLALTCYRIMSRAFSGVIKFHNKQNRATGGGICVANHTSPIDIIILGTDNCYSMVGQQQGGFFGIMQRAFSRAESHIWFNRQEAGDREKVARRLREHANDKNKLPILIFPEGTCISNNHVLQFKKGSFEVDASIHPIAIKYDPLFADPFWNSSKHGMIRHLLMIFTSWALVVDIWYLPERIRRDDEDAIQFANRVKAEIAEKGGLVDTEWDGLWKRNKPKDNLTQREQKRYIQEKRLLHD